MPPRCTASSHDGRRARTLLRRRRRRASARLGRAGHRGRPRDRRAARAALGAQPGCRLRRPPRRRRRHARPRGRRAQQGDALSIDGLRRRALLPAAAWLPKLVRGTDLHVGILVAVAAVVACHLVLWRTPFGFRLRVLGASEGAARYAGIGAARATLSVMMLAGGLAGVAGAIEVLGVHYRLIEGFSQGFGFAAVSIALIGGLSPLGVLPAGLFFGFLESGALAMQRAVGVPTPLVSVIQGLTMIFVLAAMALSAARARGGASRRRAWGCWPRACASPRRSSSPPSAAFAPRERVSSRWAW